MSLASGTRSSGGLGEVVVVSPGMGDPEGGVTSSSGRVQSGGTQGWEMVAEAMGMGPWFPKSSDSFPPQPQKDDTQGLLRSLETRVPAALDTSPTGRRRRHETNVSGEEALDVSGGTGDTTGAQRVDASARYPLAAQMWLIHARCHALLSHCLCTFLCPHSACL